MHITYVHLHMHCVCGEGGTDAHCTPLTPPPHILLYPGEHARGGASHHEAA